MNFLKSTLAVALVTATSYNVMAADLDFYGRASVSLQSSDEVNGSFREVKSNASRLGVKGSHDLKNGLEVIFQAEFEIDIDSDDETFKDRNQYIGLKGKFGTVLLGTNDTMLKQSQGKIDQFNDLNGDIKSFWKPSEYRAKNSVTYISPKFSEFTLGVTYIAAEDASSDIDDGISVAAFYGDAKLKKSTVYAALAFDTDVNGYDTQRASVQTKMGGVTLGAMYNHQEEVTSSTDTDGFMVSAAYSINAITLKGQIQTAKVDGGDSQKGYSVGADYKLDDSTKLYSFYTSLDLDSEEDKNYLGVGIEYNF